MRVVIPQIEHLPVRLSRLSELSYNLWWSWHLPARELFRRLDLATWRSTRHNPVMMLRQIPAGLLEERAADPHFLSLYDEVLGSFGRHLSGAGCWYQREFPDSSRPIAYFCAEYGLHNSLPIYSGGLGLLAGDTCKEASDLGIPLVAVGYFYPQGYFRQRIASDGRQEAEYARLDPSETPLLPVVDEQGRRCLLSVPLDDHEVKVSLWKVQAGRVPIYLMDTCIEENDPCYRDESGRLYGGDQSVRMRQEVILGMGGMRVLEALGIQPSVVHLNEGHAAFASLELLAQSRRKGLGLKDALSEVRSRTVFTTHTPVKAGHDEFSFAMMEEFLRRQWEEAGLTREGALSLGKAPGADSFVMTILALRTSSRANAVSRRHAAVSREMWRTLWPELPQEEVPIGAITNGVHVPTWIAPEMDRLFRSHLGEDWMDRHDDPELWAGVDRIPPEALWQAHVLLKHRLIRLVQDRARRRWTSDGLSGGQIAALGSLLDPDVLTVGFARRFATYKRGALILSDRQRLRRILCDPRRPVQIIFAGKAHPADEPGKSVLQQVFQACMNPEFEGRLAFVEEYDKHVAQHLVQGVDVWLNNPRPPLEASGTSGQKAALNGVLNCSVMDGWWCEGYDGRNGWAIDEQTAEDDQLTAQRLYQLLEEAIVPTYYDREGQDLPLQWIARMRAAISSLAAPFSARRMMKEYVRRMYFFGGEREGSSD